MQSSFRRKGPLGIDPPHFPQNFKINNSIPYGWSYLAHYNTIHCLQMKRQVRLAIRPARPEKAALLAERAEAPAEQAEPLPHLFHNHRRESLLLQKQMKST